MQRALGSGAKPMGIGCAVVSGAGPGMGSKRMPPESSCGYAVKRRSGDGNSTGQIIRGRTQVEAPTLTWNNCLRINMTRKIRPMQDAPLRWPRLQRMTNGRLPAGTPGLKPSSQRANDFALLRNSERDRQQRQPRQLLRQQSPVLHKTQSQLQTRLVPDSRTHRIRTRQTQRSLHRLRHRYSQAIR